jgi:hypothetical protein
MPGDPTHEEILLTIKVSRLGDGTQGTLQIGRRQINDDFSKVMEKALKKKPRPGNLWVVRRELAI